MSGDEEPHPVEVLSTAMVLIGFVVLFLEGVDRVHDIFGSLGVGVAFVATGVSMYVVWKNQYKEGDDSESRRKHR